MRGEKLIQVVVRERVGCRVVGEKSVIADAVVGIAAAEARAVLRTADRSQKVLPFGIPIGIVIWSMPWVFRRTLP